jgi:hypothetical protein
MKLPLKPFDILAILVSALLVSGAGYKAYKKPKSTPHITVYGSSGTWVYPLDAEETIEVPGPLGTTVVRIHEHEAWVEDSPCDNKTCVAAGHIGANGQWVACLPNNVFLALEADNETGTVDTAAW